MTAAELWFWFHNGGKVGEESSDERWNLSPITSCESADQYTLRNHPHEEALRRLLQAHIGVMFETFITIIITIIVH